MKSILIIIFFATLLIPQQQKNSSKIGTQKEPEKVVQETTKSDNLQNEKPTKIEIVKVPDKTVWDNYSQIIIVLIGVIIGWLLSFISQNRLIKKQLNYTRKENWLKEFIDISSEFLATEHAFRKSLSVLLGFKEINAIKESIIHQKESFDPLYNSLLKKIVKLSNLLDNTDTDEDKILYSLKNYSGIIDKVLERKLDSESNPEKISHIIKEIIHMIQDLIIKRRNELNKI